MTQSENYGQWVNKDGKNYFQINIPLSLRGFSKKRIDHRHHAMDAIVIACATRDHVNYLSNAAACSNQADLRYDLQHKLCSKEKTDDKGNYVWRFIKPWETFTQDTRQTLMNIVVSFKQNLRVINKMTNFYDHFENGKRVKVKQEKGDGWAIRKSLHKATVSGAVRIQRKKKVKLADALDHLNLIVDKEVKKDIKGVIAQYHKFDPKTILKYYKDRKYLIGKKEIKQVEIWDTPEKADYSAERVNLDSSFTKEKITKITDTGIQKILLAHLANYNDKANEAFSAEGIAAMNKNIKALNGGKDHKPILKVRKMESFGLKYPISETGNKSKKYVEADKGTNLFYAVYENENGERIFESIPLITAIERMKQNEPVAPYQDENGNKLLFVLSIGDLVYVPDEGEHVHDIKDCSKIYKMVSSTTNRSFYVPHSFATPIVDKFEIGTNNRIEKIQDGPAIKNICYKLKVDRLGNVELI
jgi:CRISPR-associated endonuclease Csn1